MTLQYYVLDKGKVWAPYAVDSTNMGIPYRCGPTAYSSKRQSAYLDDQARLRSTFFSLQVLQPHVHQYLWDSSCNADLSYIHADAGDWSLRADK